MTASAGQAAILGDIFGLTDEDCKWLQVVPYKGSLQTGIMSAIDFSMDIVRQPDPKSDRVNVVLSGKFLPYKQY